MAPKAPMFYSIESIAYPGYFVTQQGSRIVLNAKDLLNPYQIWCMDESWKFLTQTDTDLCPFVLINHGSKKALQSQQSATRKIVKATVGAYDPAVEDDGLLWSFSENGSGERVRITRAGDSSVFLTHVSSSATFKDGIPVVTSPSTENSDWKIAIYEPPRIRITCRWGGSYLTCKRPNVAVTFRDATVQNDETNVVAVSPNIDNILDGTKWYKIPAGGRDDTTYSSSFVVMNKVTRFALKGSTKPGDKVLLTQYDPLDYGFVWSENRYQASKTDHVAINLDGTNLQWTVQNDDQYQNSAWYHPLILRPGSSNQGFVEQQAWKFNPVTA